MDHNTLVSIIFIIFLHIHSEYLPKSFSFCIVIFHIASVLESKDVHSSFTLKLGLSL